MSCFLGLNPNTYNSKILTLKHLLCVPNKILLSVPKFTRDNSVFFEFHPNTCSIKDQASKAILMAKKVKDGFYTFDSPHMIFNLTLLLSHSTFLISSGSTQVLSTSCSIDNSSHTSCSTSSKSYLFDLWHNRLHYPFEKVVKCVLSHCNMPNFNKMKLFFSINLITQVGLINFNLVCLI